MLGRYWYKSEAGADSQLLSFSSRCKGSFSLSFFISQVRLSKYFLHFQRVLCVSFECLGTESPESSNYKASVKCIHSSCIGKLGYCNIMNALKLGGRSSRVV